jgi:hypothetical protein
VEMRAETYKPEQAGPGQEWIDARTMAWYAADFASVFDFSVYGKKPPGKSFITPAQWKLRHKKR